MKGLQVLAVVAGVVAASLGSPLAGWTPDSPVNADELGPFNGSDMEGPLPPFKNGLVDEKYRWPDATVIYEIAGDFTTDELATIQEAMNTYYDLTDGCILFKERTNEDDYVRITNDDSGCHSSVGRKGGRQSLNLESPKCLRKMGTVEHEMLHTLGFHHEQSRFDRDEYVTIMWENISSGHEHNFVTYPEDVATGFGESYDYGSVMHYSRTSFSANGEDTIVPVNPNAEIGQRVSLSVIDVAKLMKMYKCGERK
ncbi:zinc metalloproteinase nas-14-like [Penaeus japonicus]|uniref:zinc metalloproteinase nas-14-like n=1 Tax=Penaeus japonicus TaxID=27405 RepID=UPI001C70F1B7|nr:zinc metalloproteinase nas-14-like [Penaeus japonicus]